MKISNGKLYWYSLGLDPLAESDLSGNLTEEYIFFGGKRIARRTVSSGAVNYYFADHLGSSRVVTNAAGTILDDSDFYPFGGERVVSSSSGNNYKFTGKERDTESNLDNFVARYFASSLGRFSSSDFPLLDQYRAEPQSWNLYAYARNNPLIFIDPTGNAVELLGNEEDRKKELALLQESVGNKEAASRLYINEVKDGDQTRYFVGIKGDKGDFMKLSDTSHDLANLVQEKQVVEFGLTNNDLSEFGGAVTLDKGERGNQNVRVLVNPGQLGIADRNLSPTTVLGFDKWEGRHQDPRWRVRSFTPGIAAWHEFGHAWGIIHGRTGSGQSDKESIDWENRLRKQVYSQFSANNARRVKH